MHRFSRHRRVHTHTRGRAGFARKAKRLFRYRASRGGIRLT